MRDSVRAAFVRFNGPLEGVLPFMYSDSEGYVTTAMGFLLPTAASATELPWRNPDGSLADAATVQAQWQAVKDGPVNSSSGAGYLTTIRLDDAGIQAATDLRIGDGEPVLRRDFPTYDTLSAYAQLALWSMAWAMGPAFRSALGFSQFGGAIDAGRFQDAAPLGHFKGSGVATRIAADDQLFAWAQLVADGGLDPEDLSFSWQKTSSSPFLTLTGGPGASGIASKLPTLVPLLALAGTAAYLLREEIWRWLRS